MNNIGKRMLRLSVEITCISAICFSPAPATAANFFKMPVTYYDFNQDRSNLDFGHNLKPAVTFGLIQDTLDADKKPLKRDTTSSLFLLDHLSTWYRPWHAGDTLTVDLPADTITVTLIDYTQPVPEMSDTGEYITYPVTYDSTVYQPARAVTTDTLFKNAVVQDSLQFNPKPDTMVIMTSSTIVNGIAQNTYDTLKHPNAYEGGTALLFLPINGRGLRAPTDLTSNYCFTMELHNQFLYDSNRVFRVSSDDDFACFINGKIAVDLFCLHASMSRTIQLDSIAAQTGIVKGNTYDIDCFYAERCPTGAVMDIITDIQFVNKTAGSAVRNPFVNKHADGRYYSLPFAVSAGKNILLPFNAAAVTLSYFSPTGRLLKRDANVPVADSKSGRFDARMYCGLVLVRAECRDASGNHIATVLDGFLALRK